MGLDIWFKDDIRNVLVAVNAANASASAMSGGFTLRVHPNGFTDLDERARGPEQLSSFKSNEPASLSSPEELRAYREGFKAALVSTALAFGISFTPLPEGDASAQMFDDRPDLRVARADASDEGRLLANTL